MPIPPFETRQGFTGFAYPVALGDLPAARLAFAFIPVMAGGWQIGRPMVWIFNIFGLLDLLV
ncbi:MAG TPA: hypothetical protein VD811_07260 [Desulfuromonadales bacterium]|nr:hypothetical protein [Desulfuromonadales bacterium]